MKFKYLPVYAPEGDGDGGAEPANDDGMAAAMAAMIQPADKPKSEKTVRAPDGKFTKQQDDTDGEEDPLDEDSSFEKEEAGEGDPDEEKEDQGDEGQEEEDGEESLDLDDDVIVEVLVDGKVEEATLADLKKNYSGNKYIEKQIQQTVEKRKEVEQLSTYLVQNNTQLVGRLKQIDAMLQAATEPQIDWDRLKQEDPQEYILRRDELREAKEKQQEIQAEIQRVTAENDRIQKEALRRYTEDQAQRLIQAEPEFGKKEKSKQLMTGVAKAASHYGFTPQELATVVDHRMILVLHDLAKFRKVTEERENTDDEAKDKLKTRKRRIKLRSAARTTQRSQSQKKQQAVVNRARQTGDPDDVAATLLVQPRRN